MSDATARTGPLRVEGRAGVATVTIDHPPFNLVDGAFLQALLALLDRAEADPDTRVLLFVSADPQFFLMHGDVVALAAARPARHVPASTPNPAAAAFDRLRTSPLVSIAAIDGAARGGGAEFATALDLRYGSERAVLGQPEVPMGILPGAGGTVRLPRLLGRDRALEVILTGRDVDAHQAAEMGWLTAVVPSASLYAHAGAVARRIAAMPTASVAAVKTVVDRSLGGDTDADALTAESDALGQLMAAGTHTEPMRRFLAAGGQTREVESGPMMPLAVDAMLDS